MDLTSPEYKARFDTIGAELIELSESGRPVDLTFYNRKPILNVRVSSEIYERLKEGVIVEDLHLLLENLALSNGERINMMDVWIIYEMPEDGLSADELAAVDLSEGDDIVGTSGETFRQMVGNTYHCETPEEEECYLRRVLAALEY